jgi:Holliday junction resolvase RusA-like endonuclease
MIEITIPEPVVPYTRMTQRSKYVNQAAHKYLMSRDVLRWYMRQAMEAGDHTMLDHKPLCCILQFSVTTIHKADLDNLIKAVLDAAQTIVFKDDRWVEQIVASQVLAKEPKLYFKVEEIEAITINSKKEK